MSVTSATVVSLRLVKYITWWRAKSPPPTNDANSQSGVSRRRSEGCTTGKIHNSGMENHRR